MTDTGNHSRLVETHTAYLLLLGHRVCKGKKSVDLAANSGPTRRPTPMRV